MTPKIVTIGVYGFSEEAFFNRIVDENVDAFCDLRARRGVRGAKYAFANSGRLQSRLSELQIPYRHVKSLAPSGEMRQTQYREDERAGVGKRARTALCSAFIREYKRTCLSGFDPEEFVFRVNAGARVIALFCVEQAAAACHRSLVSDRLRKALDLEVHHLQP